MEQSGALQRSGGSRMAPFGAGLSPWTASPIRRMFQDLDRMFDAMQRALVGNGLDGGADAWTPAIEARDTGQEFVVAVELPGVDPNDVEIEYKDDRLIIRGESQEEREQEGWLSRRSGAFFAQLPIPQGVDVDNARATYKHGMLSIRLPKVQAQQQDNVKRIPISSESSPGQAPSSRDRAA
jgi:HSP20 family protein